MQYTTWIESPIGPLMLASDGKHLTGLWVRGQKYFAAGLATDAVERDDAPPFDAVRGWLDRYFAGEKPSLAGLPMAPVGGAFRRAVWEILCQIPLGQVVTYGDIARTMAERMGKASMSSQAVGGAVGHNPISVIIPCHRVVGAGGSLTGYAGGIDRKIWLLEHEGVDMGGLFVPVKGTAL